jgi:hypothetical protein
MLLIQKEGGKSIQRFAWIALSMILFYSIGAIMKLLGVQYAIENLLFK